MTDLLKNHKFVRISFSCNGPLDESSLPWWIIVQKTSGAKKQQLRRKPTEIVYTAKGAVLPSGLGDLITQAHDFRLRRINVREKIDRKGRKYTVLNFEFSKDFPHEEDFEKEALKTLYAILLLHWKQVKMYLREYSSFERSLTISCSQNVSVSEHVVHTQEDAWGIKLVVPK